MSLPQKVIIFGSTGSIGRQTLEVIKQYPRQWQVIGLACDKNIELLAQQYKQYKPSFLAVGNKKKAKILATELSSPIWSGKDGLRRLAQMETADLIINAICGSAGLPITMAALRVSQKIALANKESLMLAGRKIGQLLQKNKTELIPLDSEHTAIYQLLDLTGKKIQDIKKVILPCSGGPFFDKDIKTLKNVQLTEVLRHPTWQDMGTKITIDSATMVNKAFEIFECLYLYNLKPNQIEVVIHREGILHAMLNFHDDFWYGLVSQNDMRESIKFVLGLPNKARLITGKSPAELYHKLPQASFIQVNLTNLPNLQLAYHIASQANYHRLIKKFCLLNERAVANFIKGRITFLQIFELLKKSV